MQKKILLITDRPVDKRFWDYWLFTKFEECFSAEWKIEIVALAYLHDFTAPSNFVPHPKFVLRIFESEADFLKFLGNFNSREVLLLLYTWAKVNFFNKIIDLIEIKRFEYIYLMHGEGDNIIKPLSSSRSDLLSELLDGLIWALRILKRVFQRRGPAYWLNGTRARYRAQLPDAAPIGFRTKFPVIGLHTIDQLREAKTVLHVKGQKIAVWLDQNVPFVNQFGISFDVDMVSYYQTLSGLFESLREQGYQIYFSFHPESDSEKNSNVVLPSLPPYIIPYQGSSADVISFADLIVTHNSTACYMAVALNKPILFVLFSHVDKQYWIDGTKNLGRALGMPVLMFTEGKSCKIEFEKIEVNPRLYKKFQKFFINGQNKFSPSYKIMSAYIQKAGMKVFS
ncbi:hypothetical protein CH373_12335 [Leptospira perolatii]|uniref:Uncharacterized protein n=1 Tax=Leptospira perolatii TaxID=2023191 RepID=A0A2M9ZLI4_9LEPT|nr:hypothetical protein [Leptospira perolatii]PJZ70275.1 hypothetical protein CH360_06635 [Leptospira perolatii]PJZ72841.1 hypothetical protein CH373_12335 [Leptospira perolatii]